MQTMLSSSTNGNSGSALARQPSIYSLTLEEIQNAINEPGKSFGSMNMEEFLKNIWTAEESQAMAAAMTCSAPAAENNTLARQPSLQRQNSLSLPPALSRKTVEDVWKDIQRQTVTDLVEKQHPQHHHQHQHHQQHQQRQATLGEMTLEDFLVRAGVVRDDPDAGSHIVDGNNAIALYPPVSTGSVSNSLHSAIDAMASPSLQPDWINYASHQQHQQMMQQAEAAAAVKRGLRPPTVMLPAVNPMYDGLADSAMLGPDSLVSSLALSPAVSDYSIHGRKRFPSEAVIEKTVERRQKRMIKNRESAARSRARKQAYTVELEAEVTQLKEENTRLKEQQALEIRLPETRHPQNSKIRVLRRTQSC